MKPRRDPRLRLAVLAAAASAGFATVPSEGADGRTEGPTPVPIAAAERWRLRPTQPPPVAPTVTGSLRAHPATAIPEERRHVRVVYPALTEAR